MAGPLAGVSIVVLGAGRGTRMGGPKALMMMRGRPWWAWQQERLARAEARGAQVIWVVSPVVDAAIGDAKGFGARVLGDPGAPMFASVRVGLAAAALQQGAAMRGAFVLPVDVPAAEASTLERLAAAGPDGPVAPAHQGVRGHPVWLSRGWIDSVFGPAIASAGGAGMGDRQGDGVLRLDSLLAGALGVLEVEDESVVVNLNTPLDVEKWLARRDHEGTSWSDG